MSQIFPEETPSGGVRLFATAHEAQSHLQAKYGPASHEYRYTDADGHLVGVIARWDKPADKPQGKRILPVSRHSSPQPSSTGGECVWKIAPLARPRPLYGQGSLLADDPWRVLVVEGEKCVESLRAIGLHAVTSPHGPKNARHADWTPLRGRVVVILPDHDDAGFEYAEEVADILCDEAADYRCAVRVLLPPELDEGEDIADWLDKQRAALLRDDMPAAQREEQIDSIRNALLLYLDEAPCIYPLEPSPEGSPLDSGSSSSPPAQKHAPEVALRRASEFDLRRVQWLWPSRVPLGKLTLLAGDPGLGKSFLTLDMAARLSSGRPWPDSSVECPPPGLSLGAKPSDPPDDAPPRQEADSPTPHSAGDVIVLSAEDDPDDTICPRLLAAGADLSRVHILEHVWLRSKAANGPLAAQFRLDTDLALLEAALRQTPQARLVIIDPITAYLGRVDAHRNADIRGLLWPLSELARRANVAIVAVTHLKKGNAGPAIYRAIGSLAFAAAARSVWMVARDPHDASGARRLLLPVKNNVAQEVDGLAFQIWQPAGDREDVATHPPAAKVEWLPQGVRTCIDEVLLSDRHADKNAAVREAADFLQQSLAQGACAVRELQAQAAEAGIAWRTIRRAKDHLSVVSCKDGGRGHAWVWRLPRPRDTESPLT